MWVAQNLGNMWREKEELEELQGASPVAKALLPTQEARAPSLARERDHTGHNEGLHAAAEDPASPQWRSKTPCATPKTWHSQINK